jgi:hypothetical protein
MTGFILAMGVIIQAAVLAQSPALTLRERIQFALVATGIAILVARLWRWRRFLTPHADMLLLMFSLGGAGMILVLPAGSSCHSIGFADTVRANSIMIATGLLPGVPLSRCLQQARQQGTLLSTLALDAIGMFLGMAVVSFLPLATVPRWQPVVSHTVMLAGMLAGMGVTMIARQSWSQRKSSRALSGTNVPIEVTRVLLSFCSRVLKLKTWEPRMQQRS